VFPGNHPGWARPREVNVRHAATRRLITLLGCWRSNPARERTNVDLTRLMQGDAKEIALRRATIERVRVRP
jgi:hypothetical protein